MRSDWTGHCLTPCHCRSRPPAPTSSPRCFRGREFYFYPLLFSAQQLADTLLAGEATSLCAVPTIVRNLFELFGDPSSPVFSKLEKLYCFGAPMAPAEKIRAKTSLCANFVQVYGATICGRISTLSGADLEARPDTLGQRAAACGPAIVNDDDRVLPPGRPVLSVCARRAWLGAFMEGHASGSGDSFKGGWAYPGDIGAIDSDGFLQLLGRNSDLIISGGANVHPPRSKLSSRNVTECGTSRRRIHEIPEGEEIAAFVVGADDLTEAALVAHCRVRLAPDKRPRKFVFVKDLPRNANGKVLRAELRKQLEAN